MSRNSANFIPTDDDVFTRIAHQYDFLCDIFSLYAHRLWKRRMSKLVADAPGSRFLDVASGTGDIAIRVAQRRKSDKDFSIVASDICPAMLSLAESKVDGHLNSIEFQILDAHDLAAVPDNSVDIYAISFAMKICDRDRVLPQALRVLKPGGTFACLEASEIPVGWIKAAYLKYMEWCIPMIATLATRGDNSAYDYLTKGIKGMPNQREFKEELEANEFENVEWENMTFGIVALHIAKKPHDVT